MHTKNNTNRMNKEKEQYTTNFNKYHKIKHSKQKKCKQNIKTQQIVQQGKK